MKKYGLTFCVVLFAVFSVNAQTSNKLVRADSLFANYQQQAALEAYNQVLQQDPNNFSALWHSSLLYARLGNELENEDKKKAYFVKAKERAEQAIEVKPLHTQSNFVMAVAMGRMALIGGAKERVAASRDIKEYAERALQADSSNAGAWHVLGRWNYEISDLNFAERLAANVLFGGIPAGASNKKAVLYIEKAIALNPDMLLYYYDLARAYQALDKEQQAIDACQKALQKPSHAPDDDTIKEDCRALIDDLR